ncbi:hypothetical protein EGW08_007424, partial [Elysia chlorotica]
TQSSVVFWRNETLLVDAAGDPFLRLGRRDVLRLVLTGLDVPKRDAGVEHVEQRDFCAARTDLDGEARGELQGDEVAQLGEVGVALRHEVDDGDDLLLQRQREALAQPQARLELLDLGRLLLGPANVLVFEVHNVAEIFLWSDIARVVGSHSVGRIRDGLLSGAEERLQGRFAARLLGLELVLPCQVLRACFCHQLHVVCGEDL